MGYSIRKSLLIVLCALALGVCGLLGAGYVVYLSPQVTAFYTPPEPLPPGKPGEIIKTEKIETNNAYVRAWRVMYHSRDLKGNDVAVTGIFAAPATLAPPGGYPLVAVAHGTAGLGQQCAPSLKPWGAPSFMSDIFAFPDSTISPFVQAGYAVTATDYQGLGAPGASSFLIGATEAQNVLDSIRAIRNFDSVQLNDQNFLWGHSQGGHSIAFTAQLAGGLAPDIKLNGIVLAAPAAQLQELVETVLKPNKPSPVTGVAAMVAASWSQAYNLPLETVFTAQGINQIPALNQQCVSSAVIAFSLQAPSAYYFADPTKTSPWSDTMISNTPKAMLYTAPIFVAQGELDTVIAPQTTRAFVRQLCQVGNAIEFKLYKNADHLMIVRDSNSDVIAWLNARAKNETALSNCGTFQ